mmetsp:Transcript_99003/g.275599  ORF Transcript_99003/g.275599 Transcript_99003/m.275599 type:complete len:488 (-) Transcript_99003:249-1712(-)
MDPCLEPALPPALELRPSLETTTPLSQELHPCLEPTRPPSPELHPCLRSALQPTLAVAETGDPGNLRLLLHHEFEAQQRSMEVMVQRLITTEVAVKLDALQQQLQGLYALLEGHCSSSLPATATKALAHTQPSTQEAELLVAVVAEQLAAADKQQQHQLQHQQRFAATICDRLEQLHQEHSAKVQEHLKGHEGTVKRTLHCLAQQNSAKVLAPTGTLDQTGPGQVTRGTPRPASTAEAPDIQALQAAQRRRGAGSTSQSSCFGARRLWNVDVMSNMLILLNTLFMIVEVEIAMAAVQSRGERPKWIWWGGFAFAVLLCLELGFRMRIERCGFFTGSRWHWNLLDSLVVLLRILEAVPQQDAIWLRGLWVLRALRAARVLQLMRRVRELGLATDALLRSSVSQLGVLVPVLFWLLLFGAAAQQVMCSALQCHSLRGLHEHLVEWCGSLRGAMQLLAPFRTIAGGKNWELAFCASLPTCCSLSSACSTP